MSTYPNERRTPYFFAATADALVVQIAGTFVPRDAQYERLLGNIGRQFIKRFSKRTLSTK